MPVGRLIIIIFLLSCNGVKASNIKLNAGISAIRIDSNDPNFNYVNKNEISTNLNYGISTNFENIFVNINTNRMIENTSERAIIYKNKTFESRTKIRNDTLNIGYKINYLIPGLIISNVKVNKSLYLKGEFINKQINNSILFGLNLGIILNKNNTMNLFVINSNRELNLNKAYGISLNHLF